MSEYVHGYTARESERLHDQADTLRDLLHHDTTFPPGALVLEAGCGVGATSAILADLCPETRFVAVDRSPESLRQARGDLDAAGLGHVRLERVDLYRLPYADETFDHVFLSFVLEHLPDPSGALAELHRVLRTGGTLTAIEGDHGSCYFHPSTAPAREAWQCLIDVQAQMGGDSLIGRRVYPLLHGAGLREVTVSPRMVYCDGSRPARQDGFVKKTIIPMVEGARDEALARGMTTAERFAQGIADLHVTGEGAAGTFCYTFFKGVGVK